MPNAGHPHTRRPHFTGEARGIAKPSGIGTTAQDAALDDDTPMLTARTGILSANAGPVSAIVIHPRDQGRLTTLTDRTVAASPAGRLALRRRLRARPLTPTGGARPYIVHMRMDVALAHAAGFHTITGVQG